MEETESKLCADCSQFNAVRLAAKWCTNCAEAICISCAKLHQKFVPPHSVHDMDHDNASVGTILRESKPCEIHPDEKAALFCHHHDKLICRYCVTQSHQKCTQISSVDDVSKNVRYGSALSDLNQRVDGLLEYFVTTAENLRASLCNIETKKKNIKETIRKFKESLNLYLDKIEDNIYMQIDETCAKCTEMTNEQLSQINVLHDEFVNSQKEMKESEDYDSEIELFQKIKTLDMKTHEQEENKHKLETTHDFDFSPSENLLNFDSRFPTLGDITAKNIRLKRRPKSQKEHQCQIMASTHEQYMRLISSITADNISHDKNITEACFISNDEVILGCENEKELFVCQVDGTKLNSIKLDYEPTHIAVFDDNILLVTSEDGIHKLNVQTLETSSDVLNYTRIFAISCSNQTICIGSHKKIRLIDINGDIIKEFKTSFDPRDVYLSKDGVIYCSPSSSVNPVIYVMNNGGNLQELYRSVQIKNSVGLAVDDDGTVYVGGSTTNSIYKISLDGQASDTIPSSADGIRNLSGFVYERISNRFLVLNTLGKVAKIYELSK